MVQADLYDSKGNKKGQADLDDSVFGSKPNKHLLYLAVIRQNANARAGTAHTKTRSEVRGGGCKPWRQKGTGRARAGSIRSPLWAGGGVAHGPRNNVNWTKGMNKKERRLAIKSALALSFIENKIAVIQSPAVTEGKTKEFAVITKTMELNTTTTLFIVDSENTNLALLERAAANIVELKLITENNLNVHDLLKAKKIVITEAAVKSIESRFTAEAKMKEIA